LLGGSSRRLLVEPRQFDSDPEPLHDHRAVSLIYVNQLSEADDSRLYLSDMVFDPRGDTRKGLRFGANCGSNETVLPAKLNIFGKPAR
jgi:hypothetical protein